MDAIFIKIVSFFEKIDEQHIIDFSNINDGTIEMNFLHYTIELIFSFSPVPSCLAYSVDLELNKILSRNHNLTSESIEKLFLIKHLALPIQSHDFDKMEELCDYTCSGQTRSELYEKWINLKQR